MSDDPDSPSRPDAPEMTIAVTVLAAGWHDSVAGAEALARRAALSAVGRAAIGGGRGAELGVVLADDATVARLNREYRGIDAPTNVLAFAAGEDPATRAPGPALLGDVVIARETLCREAAAQDKRVSDHFCHLMVHGVLHLLGYDHQVEAEAVAMERLETDILATLGVADPYRQSVPS